MIESRCCARRLAILAYLGPPRSRGREIVIVLIVVGGLAADHVVVLQSPVRSLSLHIGSGFGRVAWCKDVQLSQESGRRTKSPLWRSIC